MIKMILITLSVLSASVILAVQYNVSNVTVFPDRASVTRTAKVHIPSAGEHEITISGLPSVIDQSTVRLTGKSTATGTKFSGVTLKRIYDMPDSGRINEINERLKVLNDELSALEQKRSALETEKKFLNNIGVIASGNTTDDMKAGKVDAQSYKAAFDFLDTHLMEIADKTVEFGKLERKIREEITVLTRELKDIGYQKDKGFDAIFTIKAKSAGDANVELIYNVYNASWVPSYDARYNSDKGEVELTYYGTVRQNTGEVWEDAEVTLSTSRPSLGASAPTLSPWYLNVYLPRPPQAPSRAMRKESRDYAKTYAAAEEMDMDMEIMPAVAIEDEYAEPVASGGGNVMFEIPGKSTISSDNSPKKLTINESSYDSEEYYTCVPKLMEHAFLTAKFSNESEFPLLAGAVEIFQGLTYVGRSRIDYTAPGEEIEMSMGVNEQIKVERTLMKDFNAEAGIFSSKKVKAYAWEIEVSNNSAQDINLKLYEQIPVPQDEDIKVKDIELQPSLDEKPSRGIFYWQKEIQSRKMEKFSLKFIVEYPKDMNVSGL